MNAYQSVVALVWLLFAVAAAVRDWHPSYIIGAIILSTVWLLDG